MTDREMLELAAKAAGMPEHRYCEAWKAMAMYTPQDGFFGLCWNPLTDNADALRLAVKLRMSLEPCRTMGGEWKEVHAYPKGRGDCAGIAPLSNGNDDAATCRAIVLAAAKLGEGK